MSYEILRPGFEEIKKKLDEELKSKVTEKTYTNYNSLSPVNTLNNNLYNYGNKDRIVDLSDHGSFEIEIADHVIAEFEDKKLTIRGLDDSTATKIVNMYPNFKTESYGDLQNKVVTFKIKRKKARKILAEIQDVIDESKAETLRNYSNYDYGY